MDQSDLVPIFDAITIASPLYYFLSVFSDDEALMTRVRTVWSQKYNDKLLADPLYPSEFVNKIILSVIKNWLTLEKYFGPSTVEGRACPLNSGINKLLTGTKGVGKSSIMKGLSSIIMDYGVNVISKYVDYEMSTTSIPPSKLIDEYGFPNGFDYETYDKWCKNNRKGVIFFADEIQFLYKEGNIGENIVRELLCLGKSDYAKGIISGSSSNVNALAYRNNPNDPTHFGFPNLNHTVYRQCHLSPLRTRLDLAAVLAIKGRQTIEIDELFRLTGGVGRHISAYLSGEYIQSTLADIIASMNADISLRSVLRALYVNNKTDENTTFNIWKQKGLSFTEIKDLKGEKRVQEWEDQGILYFNLESGQFEFLISEFMNILGKYYGPDDLSRLQSLAFESTIRGWYGYGSTSQVLAPLIIRRVMDARLCPFDSSLLAYGEQKVGEDPSADINLNDNLPIESICNIVLTCKIDYGIDAFILTLAPQEEGKEETRQVNVTVIKIKCWRFGISKSKGLMMYFHATLSKVEKGCQQLLVLLTSHFPTGYRFSISRFALVTTESLSEEIKTLDTVSILSRDVDFVFIEREIYADLFEIKNTQKLKLKKRIVMVYNSIIPLL